MMDFEKTSFLKLRPVSLDSFDKKVTPLLIEGESIVGVFKEIRDGVVFTDKRIISINVQGAIGKKRDYSTLPYRQIQAFSVEAAWVIDIDSELELRVSEIGNIKFEFSTQTDVAAISRAIAAYLL